VTELKLSAVIACYKDAPAIPIMHARLTQVFRSLAVPYEIIFVNDGSPDDSDAVLSTLTAGDTCVLSIEHSRNFGSQNAFISGMQLATGDAVILLDGDLQDPPELIDAFYAKWRQGYDVVYGRRVKRAGQPLLGFFAGVFYRVFRSVSEVPMPVGAGDFALMDRKVVDALLTFPETDQFLRGLRAWVGFSQTGVDYVRPQRPFGRSNHNWRNNVWWAKKGIFSFTFAPIEALGYLGTALTLVSFGALLYTAVDALVHPTQPHGFQLVGSLVAFFGSLNLLALAMLGEYLGKLLEEAKKRPKFIRKALRHGATRLTTPTEMHQFLLERMQAIGARRAAITMTSDHHED
jgi:polyisoprenyl-phosphate glycosyltransferase